MNGGTKLIKDIRFLERALPDVTGNPMPDYLGQVYKLEDKPEIMTSGSRLASKLAERGLTLPGFHHLYVTLSGFLPEGEVRVGDRQLEWWMRYVDIGVSPDRWPHETASQRDVLIRAASSALRLFVEGPAAEIVDDVLG